MSRRNGSPSDVGDVPADQYRSMFMNTLNMDAEKDLLYLGLMDNGPDGYRPEVDGETLYIALPLSQFTEDTLDNLAEAIGSAEFRRGLKARVAQLIRDGKLASVN